MENRRSGVGLGVFLLTLGLLWILISAGIVTWSVIDALFVLWPLLLVLIGVGIIFRRNAVIRALAWVVFLAVVVSYGHFIIDKGQAGKNMVVAGNSGAVERMAQTGNAELRIALGGTQIDLDSDTSNAGNLLEYSLQDEKNTDFSSKLLENNAKARIAFEKKRYAVSDLKTDNNGGNSFHLSKDAVWDVTVDTGAINGSFDLSGLRVGNLDFNMGAANVKLVMGSYNTKLSINAGASKIGIELPGDTGMRIKFDGGLNSDNFHENGWEKRSDGWYYSPGYDGKEFAVEADGSMGLVNLTVEQAR